LAALERAGAKAILLDVRNLGFIDSSGLQVLLRAYRRSETNGHRFLLTGASPIARRLCEITGTEFLLDAGGTAQLLGRFTGNGSRTVDYVEAATDAHI